MTILSRPTVYLSASLLFLPGYASADAQGWTCQQETNGSWSCAVGAPANADAKTAAQPPLGAKPAADAGATPPPFTPNTLAQAVGGSLQQSNWDWVDADKAPAGAQCYRPNGACRGVYVEPEHNWEDADKAPKDMPIRAIAAHSEWEGDVIKMDGGVTVTQGNTKLTAERAEMHRSNNQVNLYGDVVVNQPHMKITGHNADMTTDNKFGHVVDAQLLDYSTGIRATADKLTRRKENVIELDRARYTRCPPDGETWRLDARHIRMNRETGRGEAGDTVIRVEDVPVFYTPYINFPIDDRRQTGFLWPLMAKSSSGFDFSLPYYLNLAPNYDATITPRVITDRGTMIETEARYLNQFSTWQLNGSQLDQDKNTGEKRWFFGAKESGALNSYFTTSIDYSRVSDNNYFRNFSVSSLNIKRQTSLNESAALNMNYEDWYSSLLVQQYQIIDSLVSEPYRKLPDFSFGHRASGENFTPNYSLATETTHFYHVDGSAWTTGDRFYAEPGISYPMRWSASFFNPELRARYVGYNLTRPASSQGESDHPQTAIPELILDSGVYFERDTSFADSAYIQTLEPRLYYLYSPYQKQTDQPLFDTSGLTFDYEQLFQPRRLIGSDRLEDFNQLATGVTSRFIETESGAELGRVSVGQIFYFANRRVDASTVESENNQASSAIAGQIIAKPTESWWAASNILWDQSNNQIQQGNASVHYDANDGSIFNIAYRYNQPNTTVSTLTNGLRQADISGAVPLNQRWRAFARFNYDLALHTALEDLLGVEYESCCWVTRVAYQRAVLANQLNVVGQPVLERDRMIVVEFQLKGLGGLGQKINTLLTESIWGYRDRY